jgi:hypothetical protein
MQRPINRIEPKMPASAYKTYSIAAPVSTHWRKATCKETDCPRYLNGWRVQVELLTPELLHTAKTVRHLINGRWVPYRYTELRVSESQTFLVFEAGQPCFQAAEHRIKIDRPELYIVRDGDHRGNPRRTEARRHTRPEHWVEDFATHQERLADTLRQG